MQNKIHCPKIFCIFKVFLLVLRKHQKKSWIGTVFSNCVILKSQQLSHFNLEMRGLPLREENGSSTATKDLLLLSIHILQESKICLFPSATT